MNKSLKKFQVDCEKPWAILGISRKQYESCRPWKKAGVSRERFDEIVRLVPSEATNSLQEEARADILVEAIFG